MALAISLTPSLVGRPTSLVGVQNKTPQPTSLQKFSNKTSVPEDPGVFESATAVDLSQSSSPQSTEDRAFQRAATTISNAASFVTTGQQAAVEVTRLVDTAKKLGEQLKSEVDPTKRAQLAQDASSILQGIDSITSNAKVNNTSVVDAGSQTFQFSLVPGEENSSNSFQILVANVSVSRNDLGLSGLNSSSFTDDTNNTVDKLEQAQNQLQTARASLDNSSKDINAVANDFGFNQATADDERAREAAAVDLAREVASSLTNSVATKTNNLNPTNVQSLLSSEEEDKTKEDTAAVDRNAKRTKKDPTAPADGEVNIFDAAE